jgi:NTE family protein
MKDKLLIDGGVLCRVPVDAVKSMGADVVVAVDVLGKIRKCDKKFNVFTLMWRTFDIVDCEFTKISMREHKPDLFIEPELGDMNQYKFKDIDMAIEKGYEIGKAYVDKIKQLITE